jgi:hypothetical protein
MDKMLVVLRTGAMALLVQMLSLPATLARAAGDSTSSVFDQADKIAQSKFISGLLGIVFIYVVIIRPFLKKKKKK